MAKDYEIPIDAKEESNQEREEEGFETPETIEPKNQEPREQHKRNKETEV